MSMNITIRENRGVIVIDLSGRLTLGGAPAILRDDIRRLLDEGKTRLLLNLAGLAYLDSAGMGLLVHAYATVTRSGGQLKLSNLTSRVKDLLIITKLCTVFEIYDDEASAIASFAALAR
jgi:anti-sigma B factor antagonist